MSDMQKVEKTHRCKNKFCKETNINNFPMRNLINANGEPFVYHSPYCKACANRKLRKKRRAKQAEIKAKIKAEEKARIAALPKKEKVIFVLPQLMQDYLSSLERVHRSEDTIKSFSSDLRTYVKFLQSYLEKTEITNEDIVCIQAKNIAEFIEWHNENTREAKNSNSLIHRLKVIELFYKYLMSPERFGDIIERNPVDGCEKPTLKKEPRVYLTLEEMNKIKEYIHSTEDMQKIAIIEIMLYCALRKSEVINIKLSDITDDMLTVRGKGNKERLVHLNKTCIEAIENWIKVRPVTNVKNLFVSTYFEGQRAISKKYIEDLIKLVKTKTKLKKDIHPHTLRHSAATQMVKNHPIEIVQVAMGHTNIATTMIYTHITGKDVIDSFRKMDK